MENKFALCATKKINILTLVMSEKNFLNETKNHNPPFKLNGRSLSTYITILKYGINACIPSFFGFVYVGLLKGRDTQIVKLMKY